MAVVLPVNRKHNLAGSISTVEYAGKVETWIVMGRAKKIAKEIESAIQAELDKREEPEYKILERKED